MMPFLSEPLFARRTSRPVRVLALLALCLVAGLLAGPASAQTVTNTSGPCVDIGRLTSGRILVDVPPDTGYAVIRVNCRVLADNAGALLDVVGAGALGTPRQGQSLVRDYVAPLASLDVWIASRSGATGAEFGAFDVPVRVCFQVDQAQALANNALFLIFNDARYYNAPRQPGDTSTFSRTSQQLNIVDTGLALGYLCGDLDFPGTISMVTSLPQRDSDSPTHPNAQLPPPDRCRFDGDLTCSE